MFKKLPCSRSEFMKEAVVQNSATQNSVVKIPYSHLSVI